MVKEDESFENNDGWKIVALLPVQKPVSARLILNDSMMVLSSVGLYKAMLVAKCCTQTYVMGYQETLAPITQMNFI